MNMIPVEFALNLQSSPQFTALFLNVFLCHPRLVSFQAALECVGVCMSDFERQKGLVDEFASWKRPARALTAEYRVESLSVSLGYVALESTQFTSTSKLNDSFINTPPPYKVRSPRARAITHSSTPRYSAEFRQRRQRRRRRRRKTYAFPTPRHCRSRPPPPQPRRTILLLPTEGGQYLRSRSGGGGDGNAECAIQPLAHLAEHRLSRTRPSRIRTHLPGIRAHQSLLCIRRRRSVHPIPLPKRKISHLYIALVQLFRVSVSASANTSSSASVAPYARPLGATLVGLGMAVLVMGMSRCRLSSAFSCACTHIWLAG